MRCNLCRDNRFEVIEKAKKELLSATNIETSPDEMACLDSFLFRCWQMGWLDRYDENSSYSKMKAQFDSNPVRGIDLAKEEDHTGQLNACSGMTDGYYVNREED